eukprot:TRINITY_DN21_c0_g4_i1.p1 TRINITY_DN21_c0_g4~~TRINITY_DN21_c0_g4_i1.p1  ORF type:complete len:415 (-),score=12.63 TRINITY_DN21_c0_g4_i1:153-1397(-)
MSVADEIKNSQVKIPGYGNMLSGPDGSLMTPTVTDYRQQIRAPYRDPSFFPQAGRSFRTSDLFRVDPNEFIQRYPSAIPTRDWIPKNLRINRFVGIDYQFYDSDQQYGSASPYSQNPNGQNNQPPEDRFIVFSNAQERSSVQDLRTFIPLRTNFLDGSDVPSGLEDEHKVFYNLVNDFFEPISALRDWTNTVEPNDRSIPIAEHPWGVVSAYFDGESGKGAVQMISANEINYGDGVDADTPSKISMRNIDSANESGINIAMTGLENYERALAKLFGYLISGLGFQSYANIRNAIQPIISRLPKWGTWRLVSIDLRTGKGDAVFSWDTYVNGIIKSIFTFKNIGTTTQRGLFFHAIFATRRDLRDMVGNADTYVDSLGQVRPREIIDHEIVNNVAAEVLRGDRTPIKRVIVTTLH